MLAYKAPVCQKTSEAPDLVSKQPHAAQVCRLMVYTPVIHVITWIITYLLTPKGWKAELAWLVDP